MTITEIITLCSVLVALIAVFLGPLITGWIAHRQIIAQMRQQWINDLRHSVSDYIAEGCDPTFMDAEEIDYIVFKKLNYLENKIELMLNPAEPLARSLIERCHEYLSLLTKAHEMKEKKYFDKKAEIELDMTALTQRILFEEWRKTKSIFLKEKHRHG